MKVEIKTGFFTVDILRDIESASTLNQAKKIAMDAVAAQPQARQNNIVKAIKVINEARSIKSLLITLSNFMLSHPSENLGTLK